jgi:hypothetical protein
LDAEKLREAREEASRENFQTEKRIENSRICGEGMLVIIPLQGRFGLNDFFLCALTFSCTLWRIWEDNIRMDLREIGREGVDRIHLSQDRDRWLAFVNTVTNTWIL